MRRWTYLVAGLSLTFAVGDAHADEWDRNSDRCMEVFAKFDAVTGEDLKQCAALWEAYRNPKQVKEAERHVAVQAFNYLFSHGDEEAAFYAESALSRLNERPREARGSKRGEVAAKAAPEVAATESRQPKQLGGAASTAAMQSRGSARGAPAKSEEVDDDRGSARREKYEAGDVSKGDAKKARDYNSKGYALARKQKHDEALVWYEKAIDANPGLEIAIYNAACVYALTSREKTALEYLQRLQDLNTPEANDRLHKARIDDDLESLHESAEFKRLTGYAKIRLINSIGEFGEDEVERIEDYLKKAKHLVAEYGTDKHEREQPVIWYRDTMTDFNTANVLKRLVNHPSSMLVPIDWDTEYDIIISWGDRITRDPNGNVQVPPLHEVKDPERSADDALAEQDKALREPDKYAREVEYRANTPQRIQSKGEGSVRRVEDTMNRMEKAGKTVEKLGTFGK